MNRTVILLITMAIMVNQHSVGMFMKDEDNSGLICLAAAFGLLFVGSLSMARVK